jgi:hypothetical protein
MTETAE